MTNDAGGPRLEVRPATEADLAPIWDGIVDDDLNPQRDGEWFGAFEDLVVVGAAHLARVGEDDLLDDLWVRADRRRRGVGRVLVRAMQQRREALWLIADPDGVDYYEALGFRTRHELPTPIARRYEALGLWPGHLDHLHVAMRWQA